MLLSDSQLMAASVHELIEWLSDPHPHRRAQAARMLVNRKEQPEVVWPALLAARADDNWMVRMQVARGAVHLGLQAEQAVPVLRELLNDANGVVQSSAAWALERFGQGTQAELLEELVRQGRRNPMAEGANPTLALDSWFTAVAGPILAFVHFAFANWLSFILFGLAGGIETDGRWTRYGGIEYAWTSLAWLPGGLLIPAGGGLSAVGALLILAGSGAAGVSAASLLGRLLEGVRPRFGRWAWRVWVPLSLWVVWIPVPVASTITYWHTVAY